MRCAGIDLGSRTIEVVILEDGRLVASRLAETGFTPAKQAAKLLADEACDRFMATGYGRHLFLETYPGADQTVTEIKAVAAGCWKLMPGVDLILDIGGQDAKVIALNPEGKVRKFVPQARNGGGGDVRLS